MVRDHNREAAALRGRLRLAESKLEAVSQVIDQLAPGVGAGIIAARSQPEVAFLLHVAGLCHTGDAESRRPAPREARRAT